MKPLDDGSNEVLHIDAVLSELLGRKVMLIRLGGEWVLAEPSGPLGEENPRYYLRPGHFYDTLDLMTEALRVAHAEGLVKEDEDEAVG